MEAVDICIVGSGFGGAISAARLSEACRKQGIAATIRVLEKGHDYFDFDPHTTHKYRNAQGNGFMQTTKVDYYADLVNLYTDLRGGDPRTATFTVLGGRGVGGGSLVYLGVKLRAPTETFEQVDDAGKRLWPSVYARATLDPYYDRCEQIFKVSRFAWSTRDGAKPWQLCTKRDFVFAQGCLKIGANCSPLKAALQDDVGAGWWSTGERFDRRQHLPKNYLPMARDLGVSIHSDCAVTEIAPDGRGYVVHYRDARAGGGNKTLSCKMLILSAGAIGSSGLLLRSRDNFDGERALSDHLGLHVSGNGDYTASGFVGDQHTVEGYKGKPMASFCPTFWKEHKFILVPFFVPALTLAFGQPAELALPKEPDAFGRKSTGPATPLFGKGYKDEMRKFGKRVMTVVCLGLDRCEGVVKLHKSLVGTDVVVEWPTTHPATEQMWTTAGRTMKKIFNALDGDLYVDSYRSRGTVLSSHPLGGCRMAEGRADGVVDPSGEVFGNPNLFVLDGAIVPTSLGVNPSLTIAAVTEAACERIAGNLRERLTA